MLISAGRIRLCRGIIFLLLWVASLPVDYHEAQKVCTFFPGVNQQPGNNNDIVIEITIVIASTLNPLIIKIPCKRTGILGTIFEVWGLGL